MSGKYFTGRQSDPDFFERNSEKITESGCWIWLAGSANGRATLSKATAARVCYKRYFGAFPENLLVCHRCDNPMCVNPAHLFLGTQKDNTQDALKKGRLAKGNAKLNQKQVNEIRERRKNGESYSALGKTFNVNYDTIYVICKHKTWKD